MKEREEGEFCPLIGGDCVEFKCKFWIKLVGKHPQIEHQTIDHYDCTWRWIPILMIENTKEAIGVSSSLDSFRNSVVKGQAEVMQVVEGRETEAGEVEFIDVETKEVCDASSDHRPVGEG